MAGLSLKQNENLRVTKSIFGSSTFAIYGSYQLIFSPVRVSVQVVVSLAKFNSFLSKKIPYQSDLFVA